MHQYATLEDTVYLWFGANDTAGSGADGATPVFDVRLAGAAADAAPILSGAATLLSHVNYPPGAHEVAIAATTGNGFAAGNTYAVFCTLLVDSQNPTGFIGSFKLGPVVANVIQIAGGTQTVTDLKDFADTGYDPTAHKVQGVVLTDTCTTNSDMVGTNGANTVVPDAAGVVATALGLLETHGDSTWATATGFSTHDAAAVVTALGTGSTLTDCLTATSVAVSDKTGFSLSSTGADLILIDGKTPTQALQIIAALCAGIVSGAGTGTEVFKGLDKLTTRVTVTVDGSGNRSNVVYG